MSAATNSLLDALQCLRKEHEKIERAIKSLEDVIAGMGEPGKQMALPAINTTGVVQVASSSRYKNLTIGEAAVRFLRDRGEWRKTGDIIDGLRAGWWETESKNAYKMLYNILTQRLDNDVAKKGPMWGLKEWGQE